MEKFNEEEIQRKIEEKRKRFIENAHRALGFYDQNILSTTEEHKQKRTEMIESEFNKVFDDKGQPLRRYDEEPSKPLILAASKNPENVAGSPAKEIANKEIQETQDVKLEREEIGKEEEDSLTVEAKEVELRNRSSVSTTEPSLQTSNSKTLPVEPKSIKSTKEKASVIKSKKRSKEEEKIPAAKQKKFSEEEDDSEYIQNKFHARMNNTLAKSKKMKKFVVNTRHCRQERETLQYVIDLCRWYETTSIGDGNLIWYGVSLRDWDIDIIRSRPKVYFNRYPGSELLARK